MDEHPGNSGEVTGMVTGGEAIVGIVQAQGIGTVFALAGASHTFLLDPMERAGLAIVPARHESGAVGAADGYARAFTQPAQAQAGVALIVGDQGLANAVPALAVAWAAQVPVVVLVANPPRGFAETDPHIDHDQLQLVAPVTKWARTVPTAGRLVDHVRAAFRHALSGTPGPVVLIIPQDMFRARLPAPQALPVAQPPAPSPAGESIAAAADLLSAAARPLILCGAGALRSGAGPALRSLNSRFGIPVAGNSRGRGLVPEDGLNSYSWPFAQFAADKADVVIVVGSRLTQRQGFGLPPRFAPDARFVIIDTDAAAFGRNRPADVAVHGDPRAGLDMLVQALVARGWNAGNNGWLKSALAPRFAAIDRHFRADGNAMHPLALGRELARQLPEETVIVGDGADIQNWMYASLLIRRDGGFCDHYPLGAMGSCTPVAVGIAAALKERHGPDQPPPVILLTGDGSIGFFPAELHAAARAGLRLITIVGNDGAWGTELHGQKLALGRTVNTALGDADYAKLAEAFGCTGFTCGHVDAFGRAMQAALADARPSLIDARIDPEAGAVLKTDPAMNMIMFSDLAEGQHALAVTPEQGGETH